MPGSRCVTALPSGFLSEIVRVSAVPTTAFSVGAGDAVEAAGSETATAARSAASNGRNIEFSFFGPTRRGLPRFYPQLRFRLTGGETAKGRKSQSRRENPVVQAL